MGSSQGKSIQGPWPQAPRKLEAQPARHRRVPAVPRKEAVPPRVQALRILQRRSGHRHDREEGECVSISSMAARLPDSSGGLGRRHRPKNRRSTLPVAQERTARRLKGGPDAREGEGRLGGRGVNGTGHSLAVCARYNALRRPIGREVRWYHGAAPSFGRERLFWFQVCQERMRLPWIGKRCFRG